MLPLALPPFTIWTDSRGVVDGWEKGRAWCCAVVREHVDLWAMVWNIIESRGGVGPLGITLEHQRADASAGVAESSEQAFGRVGICDRAGCEDREDTCRR